VATDTSGFAIMVPVIMWGAAVGTSSQAITTNVPKCPCVGKLYSAHVLLSQTDMRIHKSALPQDIWVLSTCKDILALCNWA
jgi:hypothetical protein